MDLYTLLEREDRRHNRGACPVCNTELPLADIEGHVNRCLDLALQTDDERLAKSLARSGYHPLAAAPATLPDAGLVSGEIRLPPKQGTFSAEDHAYASLLLQEMDTLEGGQEDFTDVELGDSGPGLPHMSKPGGYAVDMAALGLPDPNVAAAGKHNKREKGKERETEKEDRAEEERGKGGRRRLLLVDDGDDSSEERPLLPNNDSEEEEEEGALGDKVGLKVRLDTMSKDQLKKLCLRQHRKIKKMRFHIAAVEKDLKTVRVSEAVAVADWPLREERAEWEEEEEERERFRKASEREAERRKREEEEEEAKAIADALEAIKRQEEAERAAEAAAEADEIPLIPKQKQTSAASGRPEWPAVAELQRELPALVDSKGEREWAPTGVDGNGLFSLPKEVMLAVCSRLAAKDLARLSQSCRQLAEPAQDPLLWRELFVSWLREAKTAKWGDVPEVDIVARFGPVAAETNDDCEPALSERVWFLQFKKCYEKWRYGTITGNSENWVWDRCQNTVSGFSFSSRTHQRWKFDGKNLRATAGLINQPLLMWDGSALRIQFRPQKAFQCFATGIRDTFWHQELWRFVRPAPEGGEAQEVEPEDASFMATRIAMGGPLPLRAPYRVQGEVPMPVVALVLLQATGHI